MMVEDRSNKLDNANNSSEKSISSMAFDKFKSLVLIGKDTKYDNMDNNKGENTSRHNSTVKYY